MISKYDDENLDIISGLSVESDDAPNYRRSANNRKAKVAGADHLASPQVRVVAKTSAVGRFFTVFFILVLIATCAGLGWQLYLMQQKLIKHDEVVIRIGQQLDLLGHEMNATDSSFTQTGNETGKKFKTINSEIAKLWDVSNKRNKAAIAANQSGVARLKKQVSQVAGDSKKVLTEQSKLDAALSRLSRQLAAENMTLNASVEDHSDQLIIVRGELENLQKIFKAIPRNLSQRVAVNAEAVEAIDAARRHMISSINNLQNKVNKLQSIVGKAAVPAG